MLISIKYIPLRVLIVLQLFFVLFFNGKNQGTWKKIQSYGCTDEKIEIKDKIG